MGKRPLSQVASIMNRNIAMSGGISQNYDVKKGEERVPRVQVVLFSEDDGSVPLQDWLDRQSSKIQEKCVVRLERLREMGYELHRPEADYLRDDIYELRLSHQRVQYRMLFSFLKEGRS